MTTLYHGALRRVRVEIDPAALQHNLQRVRDFAPDSRVMAVIKANAYGHGIERCALALAAADQFAVATLDEARFLRQQGCNKPLVVFHGFQDENELAMMAEFRVQPVVHQPWQVDWLVKHGGAGLSIWLKLDTGMHRLGLDEAQFDAAMARLQRLPGLQTVAILSHFANADQENNDNTNKQLELFFKVNSRHGLKASLANSAALIQLPDSRLDVVRPGIMLYGGSPFAWRSARGLGLRPAMRLHSRLLAVRQLAKGDCIGYGSLWCAPQAMPVGVVACGYGDGYPRSAASGAPVRVNGQLTRLLGRVSMDSLFVDLRDIDARAGDEVELWGEHVSVDEVARKAGSISYELLCHAGGLARTR